MFSVLKKSWIGKVDKPDDIELTRFVGKFVKVTDDNHQERMVEVQEIQGSLMYPGRFQINCIKNGETESFFIAMSDFFCQINNDKQDEEMNKVFWDMRNDDFEVRRNKFLKAGGLWRPTQKTEIH